MELTSGLSQILREKYERRVDKDSGTVLCIWDVKPMGDGTVIPSDGAAYYDVEFSALTYLPAVNEVIEASVSEIVEFGAFVGLGPIEGLIHLSQITNDFLNYNKKSAAFSGKESKKSLKKGDVVYAKVTTVSLKQHLSDTKIGLSMRPVGLGKDEWVEKEEKKGAQPQEKGTKKESKKVVTKESKRKGAKKKE